MKIVLKPIDKPTWAGVSRYARTQRSIGPYLNSSGSGVITGLSKEDQKRLEEEIGRAHV